MTLNNTARSLLLVLVLACAALPLVSAHGAEHEEETHDMKGMAMHSASAASPEPTADVIPNYFRHGEYTGWMLAHIGTMILAWVVVMPLAIVLSIARSSWNIPTQLVFHIVNAVALVTGFVYNHATPDLYAGNAHHSLGWVLTAFTIVWTITSIVVTYGTSANKRAAMTSQNMARYNKMHAYHDSRHHRRSADSGQGTERNTASLRGSSRQNSADLTFTQSDTPLSPFDDQDSPLDADEEKQGFLGKSRADRFLSRHVVSFSSPVLVRIIRIVQVVLEKALLLLGFAAICSGFIVYGGLFRNREIFSGLAHFIKGGIFFWYGLLTLGRWMGAFGEFGWAWNIRPSHPIVARWKSRVPSAEFVESFVIWFYGASNVFLEHLNNWGGEWSAQDFEHVSITLLFFGGGLLGMIVESKWVREWLDTNAQVQKRDDYEHHLGDPDDRTNTNEVWAEPATYRTSLNPMPALTIMLLGMMMSGHHQDSMVSTMMHAQWGGLFTAFAFARAVTYALMYLKPPTSHFSARPPSELVAAFCLTSGGMMFMVSAHDTVGGIESNGLDAMTIFTVVMGLTCVLLAWEIAVFAVKGWAVRRSQNLKA